MALYRGLMMSMMYLLRLLSILLSWILLGWWVTWLLHLRLTISWSHHWLTIWLISIHLLGRLTVTWLHWWLSISWLNLWLSVTWIHWLLAVTWLNWRLSISWLYWRLTETWLSVVLSLHRWLIIVRLLLWVITLLTKWLRETLRLTSESWLLETRLLLSTNLRIPRIIWICSLWICINSWSISCSIRIILLINKFL